MWRRGWGRCFPPVVPESCRGRRSWSSGRCSLLLQTYWCSTRGGRQGNVSRWEKRETRNKKKGFQSAAGEDLSVPWWWRCGKAWRCRTRAWRRSRTSCRWRSSCLGCPFLGASERRSCRTRLIFWPWGRQKRDEWTQLTSTNLITCVNLWRAHAHAFVFEGILMHLWNN